MITLFMGLYKGFQPTDELSHTCKMEILLLYM